MQRRWMSGGVVLWAAVCVLAAATSAAPPPWLPPPPRVPREIPRIPHEHIERMPRRTQWRAPYSQTCASSTFISFCVWGKCTAVPCAADAYCVAPLQVGPSAVPYAQCVVPDSVEPDPKLDGCFDAHTKALLLAVNEVATTVHEACPAAAPYCQQGECVAEAVACLDSDGSKFLAMPNQINALPLAPGDASAWYPGIVTKDGVAHPDVCKAKTLLIEQVCHDGWPMTAAVDCAGTLTSWVCNPGQPAQQSVPSTEANSATCGPPGGCQVHAASCPGGDSDGDGVGDCQDSCPNNVWACQVVKDIPPAPLTMPALADPPTSADPMSTWECATIVSPNKKQCTIPLHENSCPPGETCFQVLCEQGGNELANVCNCKPGFTYDIYLSELKLYGYQSTALCREVKQDVGGFAGGQVKMLLPIDSDRDGITDLFEDRNWNCAVDPNETDFLHPDTDGDGLSDAEELGNTAQQGFRECYLIKAQPIQLSISNCGLSQQYDCVTNPADGDLYGVKLMGPWQTNAVTGAPCSAVISTPDADVTGCSGNTILAGLVANPDEQVAIAKSAMFCRGTNPRDADTDADGFSDARELRPLFYNAKAEYHQTPVQSDALDTEMETNPCCSMTPDHELSGRYFAWFDGAPHRCRSDSISNILSGTGYYSHPAEFNVGIGQTNPFHPDTDGDGLCDGPVGPGCIDAGLLSQDLVPWAGGQTMPCKIGLIYTFIAPSVKQAVIDAVADFDLGINLEGDVADYLVDWKARAKLFGDAIVTLQAASGGQTLPDLDQDGIPDMVERPDGSCVEMLPLSLVTNPFKYDTDDDGLYDNLDPCPNLAFPYAGLDNSASDAAKIYAEELLVSAQQCNATAPNRYDAHRALYCYLDWDKDGIPNCQEDYHLAGAASHETSPVLADSDGDHIHDWHELFTLASDPTNIDTDGDGLVDGCFLDSETLEPILGKGELCNALIANGPPKAFLQAPCGELPFFGCDTNPVLADSDGDHLTDGLERKYPSDPTQPDTDGDCRMDGMEDGNVMGFYQLGLETSVIDPDTDDDGRPDGRIDNFGEDTNCNGLQDAWESNPVQPDTDGDGLLDGPDPCPLNPDLDCCP